MEKYSNEYRPDPAFTKRLKELDPRLGCKFRRDLRRFAVTFDRVVGPPNEVLIVKGERGEFRHPDQRELKVLCDGDLHRTDMKTHLDKAENYMRDYREKEDAHVADEIRNRTKDDKLQLVNAYRKSFNTSGKPLPAFRKINVVSKRKKVKIKKASASSRKK